MIITDLYSAFRSEDTEALRYRKTFNTSPPASIRTNVLDSPACIGDPACIRVPASIKTSDLDPPACIGDPASI